ncbi:MAG: Rieske (2Fe-2S) protein, partial [Pseudomonadota bacterium]
EDQWRCVVALEEVENPGSYAFELTGGSFPVPGFVVRTGDRLFAYVNVCPHAGRHLQWAPHRFLTKDLRNIICSAHGAIFEIDTGLCVAGPCLGESLRPLATRVVEGQVAVALPHFKN